MAAGFEPKATRNGLTLKLYRGEGAGLLAFDLERSLASDDFVGFTVEVRYPGAKEWGALHNRLNHEYPPGPNPPTSYSSRDAPFQKFRWIHVPQETRAGDFR